MPTEYELSGIGSEWAYADEFDLFSPEQMEQLRELLMDAYAEGLTTYHGVVHIDQRKPGAYVLHAMTPSGIKSVGCLTLMDEERASTPPDAESRAIACGTPTLAAAWSMVRNESASASTRFEALRRCAFEDEESTASFLVNELARNDLAIAWRDAVIFAVEDIYLAKPEWRRSVCHRLLEIAASIRASEPDSEETVWSALRRATSLLDPAESHLLLPFLEQTGAVDTRQVTLQCVYRLFEIVPPTGKENLDAIRNRVAGYAKKFLDPDVFSGGENAGIAQEAVAALAALGDPRLEESVGGVQALQRRWLTEQTQATFAELLASWTENDPDVVLHQAYRIVDRQLVRLRDATRYSS